MRSFDVGRVVRGVVLLAAGGAQLACSGEMGVEPSSEPRLGKLAAALEGDESLVLSSTDAGFTASSGLYAVPCEAGDDLAAPSTFVTPTPIDLTITNDSEEVQFVYWLGYDGVPVLYYTLAPHTSFVQSSFSGHPWLVTDLFNQCQIVLTVGHGVRSGPATLASEGLAILASDEVTPENLASIEIGGTLLDIGDPTSVQWVQVDEDDATSTVVNALSKTSAPRTAARTTDLRLLLKAPATLATGTQLVRLTTLDGRRVDWAFDSISPTLAPPAPRGILWPDNFASDVFPVLTEVKPRTMLGDEEATRVQWRYILNGGPPGNGSRPTCEEVPRSGNASGFEVFCEVGFPSDDTDTSPTCGDRGSTLNVFTGSYEVGPDGNLLDVTIERAGGNERYVGGWVGDIPKDPRERGQLPAPIDGSRYVVLTSVLTGRQLAFQYELTTSCSHLLQ